MEAKKTDRRIIRTRKAIRDALIELLTETDYRKITITKLAHKADIDRKTFYTHYSSINDLLDDLVRSNAEASLGGLNLRDFVEDPHRCTKQLLNAFDHSLPLPREERHKVLSHVPMDSFLRCWTRVAKEHILRQTGPVPPQAEEDIGLLLDFYLGGTLNAMMRWIMSDTPIAFEKAIDLIGNSIVEGLSGIMSKRMALS